MKNIWISLVIIAVIVIAGFYLPTKSSDINSNKVLASGVVYKSPTCGCCNNHVKYLKKEGYTIEVVNTDDMGNIKKQYNIPDDMSSCHTLIMDNYFIEGHMPIEAIKKLLTEKPNINGIALPAMPSGSPGMPGVKREKFQIYTISDGVSSNYISI